MRRNFNIPLNPNGASENATDLDGMRTEIEEALTRATRFDVKFGKNLPKNISAASEYFPIAIIAMQLFRVAYAKMKSGRVSRTDVLLQMRKDKTELLALIELAESDSDAMYEKLHAFHRAIDQRR